MTSKKIKVIIVDDSALIRALLNEVFAKDSRIEVVAAAKDAYEARELIKQHNPDVITLDIEMPKMNGITFLENLMRLRPMPVVMISTLTQEGAPSTLRALEIGAVDYVPKPKNDKTTDLTDYGQIIIEKVVMASRAKVRSLTDKPNIKESHVAIGKLDEISRNGRAIPNFICAIGASTGGTEAIKDVLSLLPENCPPVVVTQHIPESFSASFARRVDGVSKIKVYEAANNQPLKTGCAYIAPGHSHLLITRGVTGGYICKLDGGALVNRHRPSVEVMFDSVREVAGRSSMAVMLTGMGADGAEAMLRMHQQNIPTIAQDEESSVVWGMPGAAFKLGATQDVLPLNKIAHRIVQTAFNVK